MFVPFGLPGEELLVEINSEKKSWAQGSIRKILNASSHRRPPYCQKFQKCGGCHIQHVRYRHQLKIKDEILRSIFHKFLDEKCALKPVLPSPKSFGYRSRARLFPFVSKRHWGIGFYKEGTKRVEPLSHCPVLSEGLNKTLLTAKRFFANYSGLSSLRHVLLEHDIEQRWCISLCYKRLLRRDDKSATMTLAKILGTQVEFGNRKAKFFNHGSRLCFLKDKELAPKGLYAPSGTFFQANLPQNAHLVKTVVDLAHKAGGKRILEFFCGSGNFSIPLSRSGFEIIGMDVDPKAIKSAGKNAQLNDCAGRCSFLRVDLFSNKPSFSNKTRPDIALLDPPRTGARKLCENMACFCPKNIIYVSCDPMTLERDLKILKYQGFKPIEIQPIDMFPQTYHIETVVLLTSVGNNV